MGSGVVFILHFLSVLYWLWISFLIRKPYHGYYEKYLFFFFNYERQHNSGCNKSKIKTCVIKNVNNVLLISEFVPWGKQHSEPDENTSRLFFFFFFLEHVIFTREKKEWIKDLWKKIFSFLTQGLPWPFRRPWLPTSHSAKAVCPLSTSKRLGAKKPTWGPAPRRHLRPCLGPGSAEIKARPRKRPPRPWPDPGPGEQALPSPRSGGPRPGRRGAPGAASLGRGWSLRRPRSRPLSPGVIKSEILLPVTPVLPARADLHMKGLRRVWAFSFSHSQWGAAYK